MIMKFPSFIDDKDQYFYRIIFQIGKLIIIDYYILIDYIIYFYFLIIYKNYENSISQNIGLHFLTILI